MLWIKKGKTNIMTSRQMIWLSVKDDNLAHEILKLLDSNLFDSWKFSLILNNCKNVG